MRDRLVELLNECQHAYDKEVGEAIKENRRPIGENAFYADYLLSEGVLVPPCKVGDALYGIRRSAKTGETYIEELEVAEVMYFSLRGVRPFIIACFGGKKYDNADFGKIVFLTREEAEKALAERREG